MRKGGRRCHTTVLWGIGVCVSSFMSRDFTAPYTSTGLQYPVEGGVAEGAGDSI